MTQTERSGNEIYSTALKAGRGAGVPMGQAEHMARMVSICADDIVLDAFLGQLECPLNASVVRVDGNNLYIENAHFLRDGPLVIDAMAGGATSATLTPISLCHCVQNFANIYGLSVHDDGQGGVVFQKVGTGQEHDPKRAVLSDALWDRLNDWAYKTYVPETKESLLSGAGAGLTDND